MKNLLKQIIKVIIGLFLFAVGVVMTINANLGLAPWDVFHQGLSIVANTTIGRANIMVGIMIVIIDVMLGQKIGVATICNMIIVGIFMDILMLNNLIPVFNSFLPSLIMLLLGMLTSGYACYIYLSVGWGAGPRDGLMVVLTRRTNKSVRVVKITTEVLAVGIGFILGGKVGIGTVIMALLAGPFFQFAFRTVNFDVKAVEHKSIEESFNCLKEKIKTT